MGDVILPEVLCRVGGYPQKPLTSAGETVQERLDNLCSELPGLQEHLFHESGELKDHFVLTVGGQISTPDSTLNTHDTIELMLASSGGVDVQVSADASELSKEEVQRYARHLTLPDVGRAGQQRLKNSSVLIIGAGGLGCPVGLYLAAAGIGRIGVVDNDVVEASNLQRQIAHGGSSVGMAKVRSMQQRLLDLNTHARVDCHEEAIGPENVRRLIEDYDVIVDCTDNFSTRYLVNDMCAGFEKPLVFGAIDQFSGQASVFNVGGGACFRCLFPSPPPAELAPNCAAGGVFGVLPGFVGVVQATEVLKLLLDIGDTLSGRLLRFNALNMKTSEIEYTQREHCPSCGANASKEPRDTVATTCAIGAADPLPADWRIAPRALHEILEQQTSEVTLVDVREAGELEICHIDGSVHVPLGRLKAGDHRLPSSRHLVLVCKSGARSDTGVRVLRDAGFQNVQSLTGGVLGWSRQIDMSMASY